MLAGRWIAYFGKAKRSLSQSPKFLRNGLGALSLNFSKRPQIIRADLAALKLHYELQVEGILESGTNFQNTFGRLADADGHAALASAGSFLIIKFNLNRLLIGPISISFCSPHITRVGFRQR